MTTVSRITASAVAAANENIFSLLNINADFSLLKIEAPVEFEGLGRALSTRRRENAEHGPLHRTARKLGALFEQIIPPIPTLAEAYGKRVSEISTSDRLKKEESVTGGPFAEHVGFDGTSIYAAATSGESAIAVNLLACMLARAWSGPYATALWVELVAERKKDIEENVDPTQLGGIPARIAAQQDISIAELAKLDASARAWLCSADEVMKLEMTQLRLIMKDCGILVSNYGSTYASVLDVWVVAMTSLQKLILGMPQRFSKAALLLGLSAWHIFPDLNVVGPSANVQFGDRLIADGGVITIGLQSATPDDDVGAQWSLSLSHLRYYGGPVQISTKIDGGELRISMEDFQTMVLGSVLGRWGSQPNHMRAGAECLVALRDCYNKGSMISMQQRLSWLDFLCSIAKRFLDAHRPIDVENQEFLMSYGSRKGRHFLDKAYIEELQTSLPFFGFLNRAQLAECFVDFSDTDDDESLISRLREFADCSGMVDGEGVIVYNPTVNPATTLTEARMTLATAVYHLPDGSGSTVESDTKHVRWISEDCPPNVPETDTGELYVRMSGKDLILNSGSQDKEKPCHTLLWHNCPRVFLDVETSEKPSRILLTLAAGDPSKVALYCTPKAEKRLFSIPGAIRIRPQPTYDQVTDIFRSGRAIPSKVRAILDPDAGSSALFGAYRSMSSSLVDLMYASNVYANLPGATVSHLTLHTNMWRYQWSSVLRSASRSLIDYPRRAVDLAVIASFETGTLNLNLSSTAMAMALASGNSIFVASSLLQDPVEPGHTFIRLLGNLGHPGTVLLVPPQAPMVRQFNQSSWRLVNHSPFDGNLENSFPDTSLHLSFTAYEIPLTVSVGAIDPEAFLVETLVSAYNRGYWIADIDVLDSLDRAFISSTNHCLTGGPCSSTESIEDTIHRMMDLSDKQLISIDCWEELLDPPDGLGESCIAIVRAGDN